MLHRLSRVEESHISQDVSALLDHLIGWSKRSNPHIVESLQRLYSQVGERNKHKGVIYRGLTVMGALTKRLFANETFRSLDMTVSTPVESWTTDKEYALKWVHGQINMPEYRDSMPIGIVLQSDTSKQEVLFDMGQPVMQEMMKLRDMTKDIGLANDLREVKGFEDEKEVMVKNPGAKVYNLCEDVILVYVNQKPFFVEGNWQEGIQAFLDRLNPTDRRMVQSRIEQGIYEGDALAPSKYWKDSASIWHCDGQGNLSLYQDQYRVEWGG